MSSSPIKSDHQRDGSILSLVALNLIQNSEYKLSDLPKFDLESVVYSKRIKDVVSFEFNFDLKFSSLTAPRSSPVDTDRNNSDSILFSLPDYYEDEEKNRILAIGQIKAVNECLEEDLFLPIYQNELIRNMYFIQSSLL